MGRVPREVRDLVKAAKGAGWTVTLARRTCHLHWRDPSGRLVTTSPGSPGDGARGLLNLRAALRRGGLDV